jgi:hypothetical protein
MLSILMFIYAFSALFLIKLFNKHFVGVLSDWAKVYLTKAYICYIMLEKNVEVE